MDELEQRQLMLDGMEKVLSAEEFATFERMIPRRRWRDAIPAEILLRPSVVEARDERAMRQLHDKLIEVIGADAADAMMEFVPPVPWEVLAANGVKASDLR